MSKPLVIDAGVAFKLILPGTHQAHFRTLMKQWLQAKRALYAPTLWLYEITSALCKTVHFTDLTADEAKQALQLAQKLNLQLIPPDEAQTQLAFDWTLRLKRVAAYDSFYLALAETLSAELWTTDKRLYNAANVPWVHFAGNDELGRSA